MFIKIPVTIRDDGMLVRVPIQKDLWDMLSLKERVELLDDIKRDIDDRAQEEANDEFVDNLNGSLTSK